MSNIKPSNIPNRLRNVSAEHPYVAGAVDIYDDAKGENQQSINADVDSTLTLHQSEINALDSQNYYTVEATDADISIESIMEREGVTPAKDTVYRVGFWDGTEYDTSKYSEYAWNEAVGEWKLLDVKEYTLADADDFVEPDVQKRAKVVSVGAIVDVYGEYKNDPENVFVLADKDGKIVVRITKDAEIIILGGSKCLVQKDIAESFKYLEPSPFMAAIMDRSEKMAAYVKPDGSIWVHKLQLDMLLPTDAVRNTINEIAGGIQKSQTEVLVNKSEPLNSAYSLDEDGWEVADTKQLQAFINKCILYSSVVWTPKRDLRGNVNMDGRWELVEDEWVHPGDMFKFNAGDSVNGIPYTGTQQLDKIIGFDVSVTTFMTAVNNPYSLLYTECVRHDKNQYSAWFINDAGKCDRYKGPNSAGLYYGSVCSSLSSYSTGFRLDYKTYQYGFLRDYGFMLGLVHPYREISGIHVGDIINQSQYVNGSGHCLVVSGVRRNGLGEATAIKITEQTDPCVRTIIYDDATTRVEDGVEVAWPYDDIAKYGSTNDELYPCNYERLRDREFHCPFTTKVIDEVFYYGFEDRELRNRKFDNILRNARLYENTFEDTWSNDHVYNNDICTFAGDKAVFREGDMIVLNYNLDGEHGGWSAIELFKDDDSVGTFELSGEGVANLPESSIDGDGNAIQPIDQNGHAFKISEVYDFAYGSYKARMTDGTNFSDFTYFNVIQTDISGNYTNRILNVRFSSANSTPIGLRICNEKGDVKGQYVFNGVEVDNQEANISVDYLKISGLFSYSQYLLKVYFKDEFGMATNDPVTVNFGNDESSEGGGD